MMMSIMMMIMMAMIIMMMLMMVMMMMMMMVIVMILTMIFDNDLTVLFPLLRSFTLILYIYIGFYVKSTTTMIH